VKALDRLGKYTPQNRAWERAGGGGDPRREIRRITEEIFSPDRRLREKGGGGGERSRKTKIAVGPKQKLCLKGNSPAEERIKGVKRRRDEKRKEEVKKTPHHRDRRKGA